MRFEFIHVSDVHLGYKQYGVQERYNDFYRAFRDITSYALSHKVDFVILGGDLFEKKSIEPLTLKQATYELRTLKDAGIRVIGVEGNHDKSYHQDKDSWLDYLASQEYMYLLNPVLDGDRFSLKPWYEDDAYGSYIDIGKVRIYGMKYYGASAPRVLSDVIEELSKIDHQDIEYVIFILHAGLEGEVSEHKACLKYEHLMPLKEGVDYLALGHVHKRYEREDWLYNPGSTETWSIDESWWDKGFYHVTVDTGRNPKHKVKHIKNKRRAFYRLSFKVDGLSTPEKLYSKLRSFLTEKAKSLNAQQPVVELSLEGILSFNRYDLDINHVERMVKGVLKPLLVQVKNRTVPTEFAVMTNAHLSRSQIEEQVLKDLIENDSRYKPKSLEWAKLMIEVKGMVLEDASPEGVYSHIRERRYHIETGGDTR